MTHITEVFKTKKDFKTATLADPTRVYLEDPAIIGAVSGSVAEIMKVKDLITVTNHPKRSWFAQVKRHPSKGIVVS